MNTIVAVAGIAVPVAAILSGSIKQFIGYKERRLELMHDQTAEKAAQYAARNERLEQRVAVLERILTDRSHTLGEEIESLRDKPVN